MRSFGEIRQWSSAGLVTQAEALESAWGVLTGLHAELGTCSSGASWSGVGASAASADLDGLLLRLRRLVAQASAVRTAVGESSDAVLALRRYLESTESFALGWGFVIGADGTVTDNAPTPPSPTSEAEAAAADAAHRRRLRAQAEIVDRVEQILRTAADVDADLTTVLHAARDDLLYDGAGQTAPGVAGALTIQGPPPQASPADNAAWWNTQGTIRQAQILAQHPDWVGNLDGIPALTRSAANQARLPGMEADLTARADALRTSLAGDPGRWEAKQLTAQLAQVTAKQEAIRAIERVTARGNRQLLLVDMSGERAMAAVGVGDLDTADHVAVFTPGFNTTVEASLEGHDESTALLKRRTDAQLVNAQTPGTVAAVTWLGYQPPNGDISPTLSSLDPDNLAALYPVSDDDVARRGAVALSSFYNGIDASRDSDPHLTALGHSYGSLTTSLALRSGTGVDDAVLYGSPGLGTDNVTDLGLPPGHVFVEEATADRVGDLGAFGRDPSSLAGVTMLATDARVLPDKTWGEASNGHSTYSDKGEPGDADYRRTTATYNQASVVAGMSDRAVQGFDADTPDRVRAGVQVADDAVSWLNQALGDPGRFLVPVVGSELTETLRLAGGAANLAEAGADAALDRFDDVREGVLNLAARVGGR